MDNQKNNNIGEHTPEHQLREDVTVEDLSIWNKLLDKLIRLGLGEASLRIGTAVLSFIMILVVVWIMGKFYLPGKSSPNTSSQSEVAVVEQPLPEIVQNDISTPETMTGAGGVFKLTTLHTNIPSRPRYSITKYVVEQGDTIFGIAEKFNLNPETILWGNYYTLADNPHNLKPGQELNILPTNGVYYEWHAGDGLNGVAEYYAVTPEEIINYPANNLSLESVGDFANPNIETGTWLIIPGGVREFVTWSAPRITRENPAVAKVLGAGACEPITEGPIGTSTYVWPSTERFLSGFDYSPETNHYGIDIGGNTGNAIFASDSGVVVYAGWNDWGYGEMVVIDHGNGWQSLYAHLSALNVGCGSYVYQGDVIGAMGSTGNSSGPHLHFEIRSDTYRVNPWNFLN